jgi:hypothetical protein
MMYSSEKPDRREVKDSVTKGIPSICYESRGEIRTTKKGGGKMERSKCNSLLSWIIMTVMVCAGFVMISGCATTPQQGEGPVATLDVCPSAEITALTYSVKESEFSGGPKFHIKVGIKNISNKDNRYRVSIFLPDGAAAGGFYPVKGKPPVLKTGQEMKREFPMYSDQIPDTLTVKVEEIKTF